MNKLINALRFQLGWWACIAGIGHGFEIEAIAFCVLLIMTHLYFSTHRLQDIQIGMFALAAGILVDTALQYLSVIQFYGWALGPLSPFWLWMLWLMFALTLNASLAFLKNRSLAISAALGAIFGPLTYYAGATLGAAHLDFSPFNLAMLAIAWMLVLPLLVMTAQALSHTQQDHT